MCAAPPFHPHFSTENGLTVKDGVSQHGGAGSNLSLDGAAGVWHSAGFWVCLLAQTEAS